MDTTFERAFGDLRSILQQLPLETSWRDPIEFNESPTWAQYRDIDQALFALVSLDPARARAEVEPYVASSTARSDWCRRPHFCISYGDGDLSADDCWLIATSFPSLFYLLAHDLEDLDELAATFPDHELGFAFGATKLSDQKPFAAHASVPALRHLTMTGARLREKNCELLAGSPLFDSVTHLDLRSVQLRDEGARLLFGPGAFSSLVSLDLSSNNLSASGLHDLLAGLDAPLATLDVSSIDHGRSQRPFEPIFSNPAFSGLRSLGVGACEFRDASFAALAASKHVQRLERLDATYGWFKTAEAASFFSSENASNLTHLDLRGARITKASFPSISSASFLGSLHTLSLEDVELKPWAIDALAAAEFSSLRSLDLSGCGIGDRGMEKLAAASWFGGLEELIVNGASFGAAGGLAIARAPFTHTWRNLQFDGVPIGDEALCALAASPRIKTVSFLNLQYTEISRVGVRALIDASHIDGIDALYFSDDEVSLSDEDRDAMRLASHFENTYM